MSMFRNNHRFQLPKEPSRLEKAEQALTQLIDFSLAVAAICMERGTFTHEQLMKMESIIKDARRKLGSNFSIEDGMKAVRAAFRIEIERDKSG